MYLSTIYLEYILKLQSPKLINSTLSKLLDSSDSLTSAKNVADDQIITKSNSFSKFDKKYKNNFYSQDIEDIKKNKSKLAKKNRKSSTILDISQENIFINNSNDLFETKSLDDSILKIQKTNKKKYKNKIEQVSKNNTIIGLDQKQNFSNLNNTSKSILINVPLTIQELSNKLNIPEAEIITYLFLKKGISVTINQVIDIDVAEEVACSYNFDILKSDKTNQQYDIKCINEFSDSFISKVRRSPIITILGHADHGKTTLLDSILKTNLVKKEYGGITQNISGYEIEWENNSNLYKLVFLDTPGHEAFESMRFRSVQVTDIVLLVVAADDGLQLQTIEAINYINKMNLSCIVVINKIDKKNINISNIQKDLSTHNMLSEKLGGSINIVEVSALSGQNIDILLSTICKLSDTKNFTADNKADGYGIILESYLDKQRGPIANVIVQSGVVKLGDIVVASNTYGKVKSIINTNSVKINKSLPSSIVKILGFDLVPQVGTSFKVVNSEKEAKNYSSSYLKNDNLHKTLKSLNTRITSNNNLKARQLKLIIKTDTQGSLEAILNLLSKISQIKVQLNIVSANFGIISNMDVELALATNSRIISFNINNRSKINALIKKNNISFENFYVIYHLFDYIKTSMLELIDPEYDKNFIGSAIVQTVFQINKRFVAGCIVKEGKLKKMSYIHITRKNKVVYQGILTSLKYIKEDIEEVFANNECGLMCDYNFWQENDFIQAYDLIPKNKTL
uniref:Translation initiation factor IF-2, chloroplastic n=1 Tax=Bostrychia simpliciuscula TaxID=324754 RepID=A0A1Z1M7V2_9FLOR|nr:translation initiation factor 2 [Bostrychia simpliciuscula]ARW62086.1 translation initiation factor 2 [Bostrychia simpliciuscula]